jgi:hypothetical protein
LTAWLLAQEHSVQNGQPNGEAGSGPEIVSASVGTPVQPGTIVHLVNPGGDKQYYVELRWNGGTAKSALPAMLVAADVVEGRIGVELGNPTELPFVHTV